MNTTFSARSDLKRSGVSGTPRFFLGVIVLCVVCCAGWRTHAEVALPEDIETVLDWIIALDSERLAVTTVEFRPGTLRLSFLDGKLTMRKPLSENEAELETRENLQGVLFNTIQRFNALKRRVSSFDAAAGNPSLTFEDGHLALRTPKVIPPAKPSPGVRASKTPAVPRKRPAKKSPITLLPPEREATSRKVQIPDASPNRPPMPMQIPGPAEVQVPAAPVRVPNP